MSGNSDVDSLLLIGQEVSKMMKDLEGRINTLYDKYTDSSHKIPKLPSYEALSKSDKLRYSIAKNLTDSIDELAEMNIRIGILYRGLSEYANFQPTSKAAYSVATRFKTNIKYQMDVLTEYKFELRDLIKNANNKLRVLESFQFMTE